MARIRNDEEYQKKKTDIVEVALKILLEEGYDQLGINHLLRVMDMSKGAFFHYFKSKDDLLQGLLEYVSSPIIENIKNIADDHSLNAVEKFTNLYQTTATRKVKYGHGLKMLIQVLYQNKNKTFLNNVMDRTMSESQLIYERIILQGVAEGVFHVEYVHGTAYHILAMTVQLNQAISQFILSDKDTDKKMKLIDKIMAFENIVNLTLNCDTMGHLYDLDILKKGGIL